MEKIPNGFQPADEFGGEIINLGPEIPDLKPLYDEVKRLGGDVDKILPEQLRRDLARYESRHEEAFQSETPLSSDFREAFFSVSSAATKLLEKWIREKEASTGL